MAKSTKKSTTKYYTFRGEVSYAQVYEPDEFRGAKNYKLNLHPSADVIQEIKDAGIQLTLKNKETEGVESGKHFTFKRPYSRDFRDGTTVFAPPALFDENGDPLVWYEDAEGKVVTQVPEGEELIRKGKGPSIGNGSVIEIDVEVYQTKTMGIGNRLRSIKIIELIEYVRPDEDEEVEEDEPEEVEEKKPEPKKVQTNQNSTRKKSVSW